MRVTDCMPVRVTNPEIVRFVECLSGRVDMRMDLAIRFGYGEIVPWVRNLEGLTTADRRTRRPGAVESRSRPTAELD